MDVFQAIQSRREITSYTDQPIPADVLRKIVDAGYYAPTGNNLPSKALIVVREQDSLSKLSQTTPYMNWLTDAQAAIVITAKPDVSKYWIQDASIASAFIWLEIVEAGLGAAFGAVYHYEDEQESRRRENHVRQVLGIPDQHRIVAILGFGYPKEIPDPKKHVPREKIVYYEQYN